MSSVILLLRPSLRLPVINGSITREDDHGNRKVHYVLMIEVSRKTREFVDWNIYGGKHAVDLAGLIRIMKSPRVEKWNLRMAQPYLSL
jgi:hypothetical protein